VGMGIWVDDAKNALGGQLRTTTSTKSHRHHVHDRSRIPFGDDDANNEYSRNVQIADLNALNAALAVVKWKKLFHFYDDLEHEYFSIYEVDGNDILNEDQRAEN